MPINFLNRILQLHVIDSSVKELLEIELVTWVINSFMIETIMINFVSSDARIFSSSVIFIK